MQTKSMWGQNRRHITRVQFWALALIALFITLVAPRQTYTQVATGTLTGTVYDTSQAVIPGAEVVLKDDSSNSERKTISNGSGIFNFAAVTPGSYSITISASGFAGWAATNVVFNQGENRSIPNINLKAGSVNENVEVTAMVGEAPLDTGESRVTLNTQMVTELSIVGRNAAELMKIMPGMAMNTGLGQSQFDSRVTSTNSGPAGAFSSSGTQPFGSVSVTTDGANIIDGGNGGTQTANINQDQTAEVTILNSAGSAEYAKGPTTFQAISKSGGATFHGSAYFYARDGVMNAFDSYLKNQELAGGGTATKPQDQYFYPGGTIGGPVIIPGVAFNRNRDKLFFFGGYEYMQQQPAGTLHQLVVPTDGMLAGDFSSSSVGALANVSGTTACADSTAWNYGNYCATSGIVNGQIPVASLDPNALAMAKLFPKANQNPTSHNGSNYSYLDSTPTNRWEARAKLDYVPTQNLKFSGSYTHQSEADINNFGVWWTPSDALPYPTQLDATTLSKVWALNATEVLSSSLTNETIFAYSFFTFPPTLADASKVNPSTVGYTAKGAFQPNITPQIPNMVSWGCNNSSGCFPGFYAPTFSKGFNNGAFGNIKRAPSIADNVSKLFGRHTAKFGAYWDMNQQYQTSGSGPYGQGMYTFDNWAQYSTGNPIADMMIGHASGFQQTSALPITDIRFHQYSLFAQDQWKATRRLTLTYGLRFDHEGQWFPANHPGFAVWDPALYSNDPTAPANTGVTWHAINKSVPVSGFKSAAFYPAPRVGAAYDVHGDGTTVLRGGFGIYRFQLTDNDIGGAFAMPLNVVSISSPSLVSFADASNYAKPGVSNQPNLTALKMGDNRTPYTENWDVIVTQQIPGNSTFELQYVGNLTKNALLSNGVANINKIPLGALFAADPKTGVTCMPGAKGCANNLQDYRPFSNYGATMNIITHGSRSNYHAMVATWQKQRGPITFSANYTFSKVMGIRDGQTNNGGGDGAEVDQFNLENNYGVLAYDHTQIFNAAYVIHLPSPIHGNAFAKGALNGWEMSGITQAQSGAPIQPNTGGNLYANISGASNQNLLGTDAQTVMPILTCNPAYTVGSGIQFNPKCFSGAQFQQNGPAIWPTITGPMYWNSDLAVYKNFKVTERNTIQFRVSGFNFLNHALPQLGLGGDTNLYLTGVADNPTDPKSHINYTNTSGASFTGKPQFTVGRRMMELAVKYNF